MITVNLLAMNDLVTGTQSAPVTEVRKLGKASKASGAW